MDGLVIWPCLAESKSKSLFTLFAKIVPSQNGIGTFFRKRVYRWRQTNLRCAMSEPEAIFDGSVRKLTISNKRVSIQSCQHNQPTCAIIIDRTYPSPEALHNGSSFVGFVGSMPFSDMRTEAASSSNQLLIRIYIDNESIATTTNLLNNHEAPTDFLMFRLCHAHERIGDRRDDD